MAGEAFGASQANPIGLPEPRCCSTRGAPRFFPRGWPRPSVGVTFEDLVLVPAQRERADQSNVNAWIGAT
jgi:hypothetical protein